MSEPQGSDTRNLSKKIGITPEDKEIVERLAEKWGIKMGHLVGHLINIFNEVKVDGKQVKPNEFRDYLAREAEKAKAGDNKFAFLDDGCPGRQFVDDKYMCIWARENKPPLSKTIAKTDQGAKNYCVGCKKTMEIVAGFVERDQRIAELEAGLQAKAQEVFKVPKCNAGAMLNHDKEDNLIFTGCKKHPSGPVSVDKFCRVYQGGLPCMMFAEITVGVGAKG